MFFKCNTAEDIYLFVEFVLFFFRLTPAYMLVIMVFTCLMKFWGSGPMWPTGNVPYDACKESWWTNILYVNNFVNLDKMVRYISFVFC